MKKTLLGMLFILPATLCLGDIVVYNGSQVVKTTAPGSKHTVVEKFIEIVDLTGSQIVTITLDSKSNGKGKGGGKKTYLVSEPMPVVITTVQKNNGNGQTSTVIAQASNATDTTTGVLEVSSLLQQGNNGQIVIKGADKTAIPRNIHGAASLVSTNAPPPPPPAEGTVTEPTIPPTPITPSLVEIKQVMNLQELISRQINDAAETLEAAIVRVKASLEAKGFGDGSVTPPPTP